MLSPVQVSGNNEASVATEGVSFGSKISLLVVALPVHGDGGDEPLERLPLLPFPPVELTVNLFKVRLHVPEPSKRKISM